MPVTDLSSYNEADAVGAMRYALRFEADQGIDSIALDTGGRRMGEVEVRRRTGLRVQRDILDRAKDGQGHLVTVVNAELFGSFRPQSATAGPLMTARHPRR